MLLSVLAIVLPAPAPAAAAGAGSTLLVSRPDGFGAVPPALDNNSSPGAVSADGRYVVFVSQADGLSPDANSRVQNVFLRDRQTQTTTLVSRSDGSSGTGVDADAAHPAIAVTASDGHVLVAFESTATNLSDHDTGPVANPHGLSEVWLRDVTAGTTTLVSRASGTAGAPADEPARDPAITDSNGGPLVAFDSQATNLGGTGVFLRTIDAHFTSQVSCPKSNCAVAGPSLSAEPDIRIVPADGTAECAPPLDQFSLPCVLVTFVTSDKSIFNATFGQVIVATAIAPIAQGLHPTPFLQWKFISGDLQGHAGDAPSTKPSFSSDGRAIAFVSRASNLGGTPPPGVQEAYVTVLDDNPKIVSTSSSGEAANQDVGSVALGGSVTNFAKPELRAVFETAATNLGGSGEQSYIRDVKASTTSLLNRAAGPEGAPGDGPSPTPPAISADGATAVFGASSSNLGDGQVGRFLGVHVRELSIPRQDVELVSRPSGAEPLRAAGSDESSFAPSRSVVSANGRFVAFESQSDSLSSLDDNRSTNVFVRDLLTGGTLLVSRATGAAGIAADADSSLAGISADGSRVAFTSSARDLSPDANGAPQTYVRDLVANTTTLASRPDGTTAPAAATGAIAAGISADGNVVVMTSRSPLDPAGGDGVVHVYVRDLSRQTTTLADRESGTAGAVPPIESHSPVIDADGGRVAWASTATLAGASSGGKEHIYLRDLNSGETELVSRADGPTGASADGASTQPAIDAAGDIVAFTSASPNLGASADSPQVFARDLARSQTELISRPVNGEPVLPTTAAAPSIDAAGDRISFVAVGAIEAPATPLFEAFVRDRGEQTTTLVSRADGVAGAPADAAVLASSISGSGDCIAFTGPFANLSDGFASSDFDSVHLRAARNTCPGAEPSSATATPQGPPGPAPAATPAIPAPVLSLLALSPRRMHLGGRKGGTTILFTLSRATPVTLRFELVTRGHRRGKRCTVKGRGKPCLLAATAGTLTVTGNAGRNRVRFAGRLHGRLLRVGSYRLTATPLLGRPQTAAFAVNPTARPKRTGR